MRRGSRAPCRAAPRAVVCSANAGAAKCRRGLCVSSLLPATSTVSSAGRGLPPADLICVVQPPEASVCTPGRVTEGWAVVCLVTPVTCVPPWPGPGAAPRASLRSLAGASLLLSSLETSKGDSYLHPTGENPDWKVKGIAGSHSESAGGTGARLAREPQPCSARLLL